MRYRSTSILTAPSYWFLSGGNKLSALLGVLFDMLPIRGYLFASLQVWTIVAKRSSWPPAAFCTRNESNVNLLDKKGPLSLPKVTKESKVDSKEIFCQKFNNSFILGIIRIHWKVNNKLQVYLVLSSLFILQENVPTWNDYWHVTITTLAALLSVLGYQSKVVKKAKESATTSIHWPKAERRVQLCVCIQSSRILLLYSH